MAQKKYVSANTKYYKNSEVGGTTGHVNRLFAENKNAFTEHSYLNFGDTDFFERYKALHQRKEILTGKKARKDATTYCETVLAFSVDQYNLIREEALNKYDNDENLADRAVERDFTKCFEQYQAEIKSRFGLEPVGFNMHLDEGHVDKKTGELIKNVHGHVGFYNYDFKKGVSPWRRIGKKQLSEMQDIADRCFSRLGFERGLSAEQTKKQHLEKDAYIVKKHNEQYQEKLKFEQKLSSVKTKEKEKILTLREKHKQELMKEQEKLNQVKDDQARLIEQFREEADRVNKIFHRFLHISFNYLRSLLLGSSDENQLKTRYKESKKQVEQEKLTREQKIIMTDTVDEIRVLEQPRQKLKNRLGRKY